MNKMIKSLLLVSPGFPTKEDPYYTFVEQLCLAMAKEGISVYVIAPQSLPRHILRRIPKHPYKTESHFPNNGKLVVFQPYYISVSGNPKLTGFFLKRAVNRMLNKIKIQPDVGYGHFWASGFYLYNYCKNNSIPLFVATGEGDLYRRRKTFEQDKFKEFADYVTGVICVSTKNKVDSIALGIAKEEKCEVFPNSTDTKLFCKKDRESLREHYGFSQNDFIVAFVGSFDRRKGPDRVAAAISRLNCNIKSFFIGKMHANNPHDPNCEGILFKGTLSHETLPDYLNMADVFVLPTQNEGCCNATVEAICCGLPVISSDRTFNYDILDKSNSVLIDPDNVEQIANAIQLLYQDKQLRERLSQGALEKAENLTINNRAKKIINFINSKLV